MIEKILGAVIAGLAVAKLTEKQQESILEPVVGLLKNESSFIDTFKLDLGGISEYPELISWDPPPSAAPYIDRLHAAEIKHGLPKNLLVRVAYQESRFRSDIIYGEVKSSAGAVGIMQIVPRWHPNVDPLNVSDAIDYAGQYLAKLKKSTGSWQMALAAYNWGIGNLKNKGFENAPKETRDYVVEVAGDVLGGFA